MPLNLVLVRHGESEGNLARSYSRKGDDSKYTAEFKNRHSSLFKLTDRGRTQAASAGNWIKENINPNFFRYYTSEYLRAMETAACLNLPDAKWFSEFYLRERDWGELDITSDEERRTKFEGAMKRRELDSFFWTPPGGESLAHMCLRIDRVLNTLHRECDGKEVIIVCHGETMLGFRVRLERMSQEHFREMESSNKKFDRIHNCQVIQYTRKDPSSGKIAPYLNWMRSVCPSDTTLSSNEWEEIKRPKYKNDDLLAIADKHRRILE
ncbi:MAG: phosphoglycerate mutase family protein [Patescibacteria group bacterium]